MTDTNEKKWREEFEVEWKNIERKWSFPLGSHHKKLVKEIDATPRKRSEDKSSYFVRENGVIDTGGTNGFTFTPEGDATYLVNTKSPSGIGAQTMVVIPKPTPLTEKINGEEVAKRDAQGKPIYRKQEPVQVIITPSKVTYLGGNMFKVIGNVNGRPKEYEATEQSLKSFFNNDLIDKVKEANPNKQYSSPFVKAKTLEEVKKEGKTSKKETPQERAARIAAGG